MDYCPKCLAYSGLSKALGLELDRYRDPSLGPGIRSGRPCAVGLRSGLRTATAALHARPSEQGASLFAALHITQQQDSPLLLEDKRRCSVAATFLLNRHNSFVGGPVCDWCCVTVIFYVKACHDLAQSLLMTLLKRVRFSGVRGPNKKHTQNVSVENILGEKSVI